MRIAPYPIPTFVIAAVILAASVGAAAAARSDSVASGPPASMFKTGYNKCKLASLTAMSKAAGRIYAKTTFDGKTCTWSSADGNYVILLDTHPAAYVAVLRLVLSDSGKRGDKASSVSVPGASKAVLDVFPYAKTRRYAKDLFAVYPQGVVQVSMNSLTSLPTARLIAVMRLVTRT